MTPLSSKRALDSDAYFPLEKRPNNDALHLDQHWLKNNSAEELIKLLEDSEEETVVIEKFVFNKKILLRICHLFTFAPQELLECYTLFFESERRDVPKVVIAFLSETLDGLLKAGPFEFSICVENWDALYRTFIEKGSSDFTWEMLQTADRLPCERVLEDYCLFQEHIILNTDVSTLEKFQPLVDFVKKIDELGLYLPRMNRAVYERMNVALLFGGYKTEWIEAALQIQLPYCTHGNGSWDVNQLTCLKSLDFDSSNDPVIKRVQLTALTSLQYLNFITSNPSIQMPDLSLLTSVLDLTLEFTHFKGDEQAVGLHHLLHLTSLKTNALSQVIISEISSLTQLKSLELFSNVNTTYHSLQPLTALTQLQTLSVCGIKQEIQTFAPKNLTQLWLYYTSLKSCSSLSHLIGIKELLFRGIKYLQNFQELQRLPRLKKLTLVHCSDHTLSSDLQSDLRKRGVEIAIF
jgi:hypothetical protein